MSVQSQAFAELVLRMAGGLQLLQLPGMIVAQRSLGWHAELERLSLVNRRLISAIALGIVAYVFGTALLNFFVTAEIVNSRLGVALCWLQAAAWSLRALLQLVWIVPCWPSSAGRPLGRLFSAIYSVLALLYLTLGLARLSSA